MIEYTHCDSQPDIWSRNVAGKAKGKGGGGKKETSDKMSKLASRALRGEKLTKKETASLGGSVLSQDETKGNRKK